MSIIQLYCLAAALPMGPGLQEAGRNGARQGQVQPRELRLQQAHPKPQHEKSWTMA